MSENPKILKAAFAGSWYSGDPEKLRGDFNSWTALYPDPEPGRKPAALILPHAGYYYSGETAAAAVSAIRGKSYSRVIVLAPSHRVFLRNQVCVPSAEAMESPLGVAEIDAESARRLVDSGSAVADDSIQLGEHSSQLMLPFLQYAVKGSFRILPVIYGVLDRTSMLKLAEELRPLLDGDTLLVASSDFTHYGPSYQYIPFRDNVPENLRKLDMGAFEKIRELNASGFAEYVSSTGATICGATGIELLLRLLPGGSSAKLARYAASADHTGVWIDNVSYLSVVFYGDWTGADASNGSILTESDRKLLLELARAVIGRHFHPELPMPDLSLLSPFCQRKTGVFVTLKINGNLRGCIGEILPYRRLVNAVKARAVDAAFKDPRFNPLRADEFPRVEIEISVLTPPRPAASWREIVPGRDGVLLEKENRGAVFLPQVASEQGWSLEEMLANLSLKAGLGPDDWREGASFQVFEAIVFGEK